VSYPLGLMGIGPFRSRQATEIVNSLAGQVLTGLLGTAIAACSPAAAVSRVHVFNRTDVAVQLGFAAPVAPCSDRIVESAEMNDKDLPLVDGAWRPTMSLEIGRETTDMVFLVVGEERTDIVIATAPTELPPCGGQPKGWSP
jgi:hypothetical protein